jgi:hypothetical protein
MNNCEVVGKKWSKAIGEKQGKAMGNKRGNEDTRTFSMEYMF